MQFASRFIFGCVLLIVVPLLENNPYSTTNGDETPANATDSNPDTVSFHQDIDPIFSRHCYGCHQGAKQLGSYVMTNFDELLRGGESEVPAIVPGQPDDSYLVEQITPIDGHAEMPNEPFPPLSKIEIDLVRRWIAEGAINDSPSKGKTYTRDNPPPYVSAPAVPSIDTSPDGKLIAIAGNHEILLLNADNGQIQTRLIGLSPRINTVSFSPDGSKVAALGGTPGERGELQIWDIASSSLDLSQMVTYDTLSGGSWSPDGSKIAFGATDNVVRAVDSTTGEQVLFQGAHEDWVRDTTFTPDSTHVISVARDMSCKLTEVATERFIDNITSITPGALSGGLSSVIAHPERNEIFVGGADGIAKVYRIFRITARKIGDDANLIRRMPEMPGRIFSVALNHDATLLAAASTLNGQSEVRIWKYDFSGELEEQIKKIQAKRVQDRNADEKKKLEEYQGGKVNEVMKYSIPSGAVYSIDFMPDDSLVTAADDGVLRRIAMDGSLAAEFDLKDQLTASAVEKLAFDAEQWSRLKNEAIRSNTSNQNSFDLSSLTEIMVEPANLVLQSPYDYAQLIISGRLKDGSTTDITRLSTVTLPEWLHMETSGLLRASSDGAGEIQISIGDSRASIPVNAKNISGETPKIGAVDYLRDVNPVLSRLGCNQGTCHGAQKGKAGFKLSLRGYDAVFDLRALTDDLAGRRINAAAPDASLMLRKPMGMTPHQGGVLMSQGDPNHSILRRWIADGSQVNHDAMRATHIEIHPLNPVIQKITSQQQVRVVAHYPDGTQRDVTREAFIESGNTEVATIDTTGLLTSIRRGEAPILARYEGAYAATTLTVMGDRGEFQPSPFEAWTQIDELVAQKWERVKVTPSDLSDDATFLRRVYLDLTGLPPTSDQVRQFLNDESETREKRSKVIDQLIGSDAYIDYWTNKWADLLQVNRKFLGVEGSVKFRDWIRTAIQENRPYDQFAHEILTATGSNNDNPPASYYKVLRNPEDTMENTTHLFLGIRFNCNKCHDHPFERWTQDQYYEMASYFAQFSLVKDEASGDRKIGGTAVESAKPLFEKVVDKDSGEITHPTTKTNVVPKFPFELVSTTANEEITDNSNQSNTRREQLASWITDSSNPYFARSYVNRLWGYLFGVGLIEPIDDIRAGNPPTNPALLDHLEQAFIDSNFDIAGMHRMICNSKTYQLSVESNQWNEDDQINYSHALPRRLPAEVIYDSIHALTGATSSIPGVPAGTRAAALSDSGVKLADGFLQNLGRPVRESSCECERSSELQLGPVMALISGPTIGTAIADPKNELEKIVATFSDDRLMAEEIFLRALGRKPSEGEMKAFAGINDLIRENHSSLKAELERAEKDWIGRREILEQARADRLAVIDKQIEDRKTEIKPERERLEKERADRIAAAEKVVEEAKAKLSQKIDVLSTAQEKAVEWHTLMPRSLSSTNQAILKPQADRSIIASGKKEKGIYTFSAITSLTNITGVRLEALSDPQLPSKGPGLAANGNFVVTEFEVFAAPADQPESLSKVKIASGTADFLQEGFAIAQAFNGQTNSQQGWAISSAMGYDHWATFRLEKPVTHEKKTLLTFKIHQFHNAADHRLGRFRISLTTADGDIPLGQPETFASILSTPKEQRAEEDQKTLLDYLAITDSELRKANQALATAKQAVPADGELVQLEKRKQITSQPTPDDPQLIQLREDVKQSELQVAKIRLTAAEDLTWALINSPAFLFNH